MCGLHPAAAKSITGADSATMSMICSVLVSCARALAVCLERAKSLPQQRLMQTAQALLPAKLRLAQTALSQQEAAALPAPVDMDF